MKPGDLIQRTIFEGVEPNSDYAIQLQKKWASPVMVIKGPYEGSVTQYNHFGKPTLTSIAPVVDVILDGEIITCIPISFFDRVTMNTPISNDIINSEKKKDS
ncbi:MAG: hypothetical protein CME70_14050 [Halobacteriovorax sp.]|nr:hypothetical protein [Halobacteriovorax sp.]|tara:strand:- start:45 stop:350 length:306 start_codon:yes stop_codon:yes gene_type:complete